MVNFAACFGLTCPTLGVNDVLAAAQLSRFGQFAQLGVLDIGEGEGVWVHRFPGFAGKRTFV